VLWVILFTLAMLVHLLAIDHGLREKYGGLYDRVLRWAFAVATLAGTVTAKATVLTAIPMALLNSPFAGILLVATLNQKLPSIQRVQFVWFLVGVAAYAVIALVVEFVG
jgi:hypothetical protein